MRLCQVLTFEPVHHGYRAGHPRQRYQHTADWDTVRVSPEYSACLQVELIQLLQGDRGQISVVGDDFQSIYGFRGAKPNVFPEFIDQFDHDKLNQPLEINYRYLPSETCCISISIEHAHIS